MVTITEDYVSFETAKILKEKGFPQSTFRCHYITDGNSHYKSFENRCGFGDYDIIAPTLAMAMKWLREVHKLSVRPRYDEVEDEKEHLYYVWFFDILSMNPYKALVEPVQGYSTYEEACEAAILYCLTNLI